MPTLEQQDRGSRGNLNMHPLYQFSPPYQFRPSAFSFSIWFGPDPSSRKNQNLHPPTIFYPLPNSDTCTSGLRLPGKSECAPPYHIYPPTGRSEINFSFFFKRPEGLKTEKLFETFPVPKQFFCANNLFFKRIGIGL